MFLRSALTVLAAILFASAASAKEGAFVSADWLQGNLDNPKVRVVEVSVEPGVYERGHIPGALNVNWHTDLVSTVQRDIVSREDFTKLVRNAGIEKDTTVILYGDNSNWFAAWAAWIFDVYGLGSQVKLLDGGRKLWESKGLPLDTRTPSYTPSKIEVGERNAALRGRLSDVVAIAEGRDRDTQLLDIRGPDEFSGKIFAPEGSKETAVRAGHVPGARNVPWSKAVNADGTLKSVDELRKVYADAGIDGSKPIIVYCRIGERSSHTWYVLTKVLGYKVRNYDGSWTEYGNAVGVPVANLAGTVWTGK
jgi:thiosulfate/3-mercaptopyruvate sulfurtransferase